MKYIRVEEGVFQVGEKIIVEPNNNPNVSSFPNESGYYITRKNKYDGIDIRYANESEIIKESDNLEDLCDEFIWDEQIICFSDKDKFHYENDDYIFDLDKEKIKEGIYGAIWTDKGLIYVAKMNKNGELELI